MNTFNLQTFDKHQGWQTLETFAHLTDADARQHEIEESNVEQGLDVKMRIKKQTASAQPENVRRITSRWPRRKHGSCGSCSSYAPVRHRKFWTTGLEMNLCANCERQFALGT